ncbi:ABC transporter permease subunit [Actinoplanes oblitus]|uniref:ABC transporter permease subunit n=1 Tax=Actinoplanes oblitus TaxID=3040509 RepID=A0ABY8WC20_9ACTN|nr:ABC transporter permease subunit [Actinoplanes oblitus]WIM93240.1 ABC transporter permease subunit [Actinoplanes oblitus]
MRAALRAEWAKLRTAPALLIPLTLTILLTAAGAALGDRGIDPVQLRLLGVRLGQAAVAAAGVQILAGEYRTGLIRATLLAVPRRLALLTAKATLLTAAVAPAALLGVGAAVLTLPPTTPMLRAAAESVLYLILIGLLGLGIAATVRSSAVAVSIVLALLYLMPMLLQILPDPDWQRALYRLTPATAVQALTTTVDNASLSLSPWSALAVVATWTTVALVTGALTFHRRDA